MKQTNKSNKWDLYSLMHYCKFFIKPLFFPFPFTPLTNQDRSWWSRNQSESKVCLHFFSSLKLSIKTFRIGVNSSPDFGQSYFDPLCTYCAHRISWTEFNMKIFTVNQSILNHYVNTVQVQNKNKTKEKMLIFKFAIFNLMPQFLSHFLI